jgi:hypothetical protein
LDALQLQALREQAEINALLTALGDADQQTADAIAAAARDHGFEESGPVASDPASILVPNEHRPDDEVPDPSDPLGVLGQEAIRAGDEMIAVRAVEESENERGEEVTTVIMQDGSKQVTIRKNPFDWPSRQDFLELTAFNRNGVEVSRTSSWHELRGGCDYTSITWPDGSNLTMTMSPTGYRTAGFTTATGRHEVVPTELIDNISTVSGAGMSGLEQHIARGGSLPMLTTESVEKLGKATKFGGPALSVATTVFDMVMADSGRDACIAALAGAAGTGGGWGGAELGALGGAALAASTGLPMAVPVTAALGAVVGGFGLANVGEAVGSVLCP